VAAKGMLGDLNPLGDGQCRRLADNGARVPKILPAAELEGFLTTINTETWSIPRGSILTFFWVCVGWSRDLTTCRKIRGHHSNRFPSCVLLLEPCKFRGGGQSDHRRGDRESSGNEKMTLLRNIHAGPLAPSLRCPLRCRACLRFLSLPVASPLSSEAFGPF
jgi:hypothetical protein